MKNLKRILQHQAEIIQHFQKEISINSNKLLHNSNFMPIPALMGNMFIVIMHSMDLHQISNLQTQTKSIIQDISTNKILIKMN